MTPLPGPASADKGLTPADLRQGRYDTIAGAVMAALFGIGALVAGAALFADGGSQIQGLAGAGFPGALAHVSGRLVPSLFALGLIEAGAVAVLTISASTGYAVGECSGAPHSLNSDARGAAVFFGATRSTRSYRRSMSSEMDGEHGHFLEPEQLVGQRSRPLPRAALGIRARAGLWALRVFSIVLSGMVVYAFVVQLGR